MDSLLNSIKDNIENTLNLMVDLYSDAIVKKYNIDKDELKQLWTEVSGSSINTSLNKKNSKAVTKSKTSKKEKSDDVESVKSEESDKSAKTTDGATCPYKFTKGKNPGSLCGCKPKKNSVYCSKHQKYEEEGQPVKKVLPKPTTKTTDKPVEKPEKILRKNSDIDKWWNPHTKMVFKSSEELVVIGVCTNKKLHELSNEDIATCRKYGFKYETEPKTKKTEKKEIPVVKVTEKKELPSKNVVKEKSKISVAINKTNLSAKDVEDVLSELKLNNEDDEDDEEYVNEEQESEQLSGVDVEENVEEDLDLEEDGEEDDEGEEEYEEEELLEEDDE